MPAEAEEESSGLSASDLALAEQGWSLYLSRVIEGGSAAAAGSNAAGQGDPCLSLRQEVKLAFAAMRSWALRDGRGPPQLLGDGGEEAVVEMARGEALRAVAVGYLRELTRACRRQQQQQPTGARAPGGKQQHDPLVSIAKGKWFKSNLKVKTESSLAMKRALSCLTLFNLHYRP